MKPKVLRISSENAKYQQAEALRRNRATRGKSKTIFVEGVIQIKELIKSNLTIYAFLYSREALRSEWAKGIIRNSRAEEHWELSLALMNQLSDKEDASEIIALARMPEKDTIKISGTRDFLVLVLDRPSSPGNFGTIIRSSKALEVDGIIMTGHAVDLYDPKTIRASLGTLFSMPVMRLDSHKEVGAWCKQIAGLQIIGTSAKAVKSISEQDFSKPTVLVLGNEAKGLSSGYKELCDDLVRIDTHTSVFSLNVSTAAAIFLYEINRQRRLKKPA